MTEQDISDLGVYYDGAVDVLRSQVFPMQSVEAMMCAVQAIRRYDQSIVERQGAAALLRIKKIGLKHDIRAREWLEHEFSESGLI